MAAAFGIADEHVSRVMSGRGTRSLAADLKSTPARLS